MQFISYLNSRLFLTGVIVCYIQPVYATENEATLPIWSALLFLSITAILVGGGHYIYQLKNQIRSKESLLERSAAEWTYAMDFLEDPMYLVDLNDIVIRANKAFYNQCGRPEEEVLGQDVKTLLHLKPEAVPCPGCRARLDRRDAFFTKEADDPTNPLGKPVEITIRVVRDDKGLPIGILQGIRDLSHLRHTEDALRQSRKKLANAQRIARIGSWVWDIRKDEISGSEEFYELFEFDHGKLITMESYVQRIPEAEQNSFKLALQEAMSKQTPLSIDHAIQLKDGRELSIHQEAEIIYDKSGSALSVSATAQDISRQKKAELALLEEKERVQVTLESIGDAVITVDLDGKIEYINHAAELLLGYTNAELENYSYDRISILNHKTRKPIVDPIARCLEGKGRNVVEKNCILVAKDSSEYNIDFTAAPILDETKGALGCVLVLHDVTQMHNLTRMLNHQATHDPLTGLINRREFEVRLKHALDSAQVDNSAHSLVFLDLDNFKIVNDTCGHLAGDELLKQFTLLLQRKLRQVDTFARLGGDEFALLLNGCCINKAATLTNEILTSVKEYRFQWSNNTFEVGTSIGITAVSRDSANTTELLSEADSACYLAKRNGKNRVQVYDQHNFLLLQHRGEMQWVQKITQALADNRFELYCQKIISLKDKPIDCNFYEILLRLHDGQNNIIQPSEFIPAAERFQLMPTIDRWVVQNAFQVLKTDINDSPIWKTSINLSAQSVCDKDFFNFILEQQLHFQIDPKQVCFEITETAAIDNLQDAKHLITQLRSMGFGFALDDFGSGMSSFAYLKQLEVDYLKIDGMFIKEICENKVDRAMVTSINQIGQLMGIKTIAEFAETDGIVEQLKLIDVDYAQGSGIDVPKPVAEIYHIQAQTYQKRNLA